MKNFKAEMLKQKEAEMKAMGGQYVSWNPVDLVYQFDLIDGLQIQQMLIALQQGYELKSTFNAKGCVEFVLSYKKDK